MIYNDIQLKLAISYKLNEFKTNTFEPDFLEKLIAKKNDLYKYVKNELNQAINKVKEFLSKNHEYDLT
jgi:hypothetical protein